jgi:hypothetical protein
MTLQELLEAVHLDALGMLEGEDRRAFDAAFDAANPAIQDQVRSEQARFALVGVEDASVQPPPYLKSLVMGRIHAEILADDGLEATGESLTTTDIAARVGVVRTSPRVSPAWRASSLGFATAAAILLAAFFSVSRQMESLQQRSNNDRVLEVFSKNFGGDIYDEAMFGKDVERFAFQAIDGSSSDAAATLLMLPQANEARLFVKNLALNGGQTARVVLLDDNNQILSEISAFPMNEKIGTATLDYEAAKGRRLGIAVADAGAKVTAADVRLFVTTV